MDFSFYDLVFIQGANPVVSAPNTQRVIDGLKKSFVVYFGTALNDTCEYADLIIPQGGNNTVAIKLLKEYIEGRINAHKED